jgi:hypothetical protein
MTAVAVPFLALVLFAPAADAREVGLFFDENAETCVRDVHNFAPPVKVWVFAFADPGDTLQGALLRFNRPAGFEVTAQELPRDGGLHTKTGDLIEPDGIEITLSPCVVTSSAPILLMTFDLQHFDRNMGSGSQVWDLELQLRGGTIIADSLTLLDPHLKLCAADPIEGETELVVAENRPSTLNCTSECPCTVGVARRSWAEFKRIFLEP